MSSGWRPERTSNRSRRRQNCTISSGIVPVSAVLAGECRHGILTEDRLQVLLGVARGGLDRIQPAQLCRKTRSDMLLGSGEETIPVVLVRVPGESVGVAVIVLPRRRPARCVRRRGRRRSGGRVRGGTRRNAGSSRPDISKDRRAQVATVLPSRCCPGSGSVTSSTPSSASWKGHVSPRTGNAPAPRTVGHTSKRPCPLGALG